MDLPGLVGRCLEAVVLRAVSLGNKGSSVGGGGGGGLQLVLSVICGDKITENENARLALLQVLALRSSLVLASQRAFWSFFDDLRQLTHRHLSWHSCVCGVDASSIYLTFAREHGRNPNRSGLFQHAAPTDLWEQEVCFLTTVTLFTAHF